MEYKQLSDFDSCTNNLEGGSQQAVMLAYGLASIAKWVYIYLYHPCQDG
jgi:hypothetical protein